ncbi:MAG: FkbM family methyltransferase [Rhodoglobus sp.]
MTTDVYPEPVLPGATALRARLANKVMRLATRIKWAEPELRGLGAIVRPGDTVFDVGAAHGMYTLPLAHLVGRTGRVESFEPHPRQQRTLRWLRGLIGVSQVSVNAAAVGATTGERTMRLPLKYGFPIYGHAHITEGATAHPTARVKQWNTPLTSVDEWAREHGTGRVAFIKVDVEGFEPNVVDGAIDTIGRDLPSLLLEIEDRHLARYGQDGNGFADSVIARWPDYGMYTWQGERWVATEKVVIGTRNYLFATTAAFDPS